LSVRWDGGPQLAWVIRVEVFRVGVAYLLPQTTEKHAISKNNNKKKKVEIGCDKDCMLLLDGWLCGIEFPVMGDFARLMGWWTEARMGHQGGLLYFSLFCSWQMSYTKSMTKSSNIL